MKAWDITRKDLKLLVRDVRTFVVLLALPVLFIWIIGMITGQLTGFDEPNRVLKIPVVDEIDYEALGFDADGKRLDAKEAQRRRRQARNTFVKVYNGIQQQSGFEVDEIPVAERTPEALQAAVDEARRRYKGGGSNAALRFGTEFFERVLALSYRDIMDSSRGGIAFRFAPPEDLAGFADKRAGLEARLGNVLAVEPGKVKLFRENVDLDNAEIIFDLPDAAAKRLFDDRWKNGEHSPLIAELAEAARPLELIDVYPSGLRYGLESLNMRLESEAPGSATHSMIEVVILYEAINNVKLFPLCANTEARIAIASSCTELEAEAQGPPLALAPPQQVKKSASRVYQEVIPGYTVLFVFFLINIMARSFIHESALGTLRRLRIAPVRPTSLLVGKTLPFLFVSLVQTALLFLFGRFFFGMDWGPQPALLLPVIFCTSLSATALGLLIATIVRTEAQVSAYANFVVLLAGLISGSVFPRDWLPERVKQVSLITPHAWALDAYNEILGIQRQPDVSYVMLCCAALVGFALLYFAIGTLRFGKVE